MADINATDLTAETLNTLDGAENVVLFDTAEGKKVTLQVLADYVVQKATESLLGSNQTVAAALDALNSKLAIRNIDITNVDWKVSINSNYTWFKKYGRIVSFQVFLSDASDLSANAVIATGLPRSLKPAQVTQVWFPFISAGAGNTTMRATITSSGDIQVIGNGSSVSFFFCMGSYISDNDE